MTNMKVNKDEMIKAHLSGGMLAIGGRDEKGYWVSYGPLMRMVWAIMIHHDGSWVPYKIYRNNKHKTHKRAISKARWCRRVFTQHFRVEEIWETVPLDETEKHYYENEAQITEDIANRMGQPRGRIAMGFGRPGDAGPILIADRTEGRVEQILEGVGEDTTLIQINTTPDPSE